MKKSEKFRERKAQQKARRVARKRKQNLSPPKNVFRIEGGILPYYRIFGI